MKTGKTSLPSQSRGVTLIELMVGLVISVTVLGAASVILVSSNKTNRIQNDMVDVQEYARFALQQISYDIQMSGYYGCVQDSDPSDAAGPIINKTASVTVPGDELIASSVFGFEYSATSPSTLVAPNRDVLELQYAYPLTTLSASMASPLSALTVTDASDINVGDTLMIANCEAGDIFTVSDVSGNTVEHETDATSGETSTQIQNLSDAMSAWYGSTSYISTETEVFGFNRVKYYVADNNGVPTLFRAINVGTNETGTPTPFIPGVEAFEVLYGEDTNGDRIPDAYVNADAVSNWRSVISVRYALLLRTENEFGSEGEFDKSVESGDTISVLGTDYTVADERVRRRVFQTTAMIRNSI